MILAGPGASGNGGRSRGVCLPMLVGGPAVGHKVNVRDVSFTADGKSLASVAADGTLFVWDVLTKGGEVQHDAAG